jgi:hypothetical protein
MDLRAMVTLIMSVRMPMRHARMLMKGKSETPLPALDARLAMA